MTDAQIVLALLGFAIGALQAIGLWLLNIIWRELRELRARVEALEADLYRAPPAQRGFVERAP